MYFQLGNFKIQSRFELSGRRHIFLLCSRRRMLLDCAKMPREYGKWSVIFIEGIHARRRFHFARHFFVNVVYDKKNIYFSPQHLQHEHTYYYWAAAEDNFLLKFSRKFLCVCTRHYKKRGSDRRKRETIHKREWTREGLDESKTVRMNW